MFPGSWFISPNSCELCSQLYYGLLPVSMEKCSLQPWKVSPGWPLSLSLSSLTLCPCRHPDPIAGTVFVEQREARLWQQPGEARARGPASASVQVAWSLLCAWVGTGDTETAKPLLWLQGAAREGESGGEGLSCSPPHTHTVTLLFLYHALGQAFPPRESEATASCFRPVSQARAQTCLMNGLLEGGPGGPWGM